ncbi:uncharacterized protein LOC120171137 [Hibiscus syriacus]|uniref:uncharacterized protein LOC120171137 n=1 Tax=Hibiscus syriacus TaxID=106335 RepID=UPI001923CEC1|nr:uncharacterized protein LOC120171137 [Hibiscus syriacus]
MGEEETVWTMIAKHRGLLRIKTFMSLAGRDILLTNSTKRHLDTNARYKKICEDAWEDVNHVLDDCLVFLRNSEPKFHCLCAVLSEYKLASGQHANFSKSSAYFSPHTRTNRHVTLCSIVGIQAVDDPRFYLGFSMLIGQNKNMAFSFLRDRVISCVRGWAKNLLSYGNREIFIKVVGQAILTYCMGCFLLPGSLINGITGSLRDFWWSGKLDMQGWPLLSWESICKSKRLRGLRLRDLLTFNIAISGNRIWRLDSNPSSLVSRVLAAKYYPSGDLFAATLGQHPSLAWRRIYQALCALREGFHWRIAINSAVQIHRQSCGGSRPVVLHDYYVDLTSNPVRCGDFMEIDAPNWNVQLVHQVFSDFDAASVLQCPIAPVHVDIPLPKVRLFGWCLAHEALPVRARISLVGLCNRICSMCGNQIETVLHVVRDCSTVSSILQDVGFDFSRLPASMSSCGDWFESLRSIFSSSQFAGFLVLLYFLWQRRNTFVHEVFLAPRWSLLHESTTLQQSYLSALSHLSCNHASSSSRWCKPGPGVIKINIDGACPGSPAIPALGVVVRDANGLVVSGFYRPIQVLNDPAIVEAHALVAGIRCASEFPTGDIIVESDSRNLVAQLLSQHIDLSLACFHLVVAR